MDYKKLIIQIEYDLKCKLSFKRFIHTQCVAGIASIIAMFYNVNVYKAYVAGLLHDYSKEHTDKAFIEIAKHEGINLTNNEKKYPYLIHGKLAAIEANRNYNIDDEELLNSLRYHTNGRIKMSDLEKIIFISDYIEPHRDNFDKIDNIKNSIFINLDFTVYLILKNIINYLKKNNKLISNDLYHIFQYYKDISKTYNYIINK